MSGEDSDPGPEALQVVILDVGHGNSAIVRDGSAYAVVDAGRRRNAVTAAELDRLGCSRIEHLIVSHADADHVGGMIRLLLDDSREIGTLWFNPDGAKNTDTWDQFLRSVDTRSRRGGLDDVRNIHTACGSNPTVGRATMEVVHPSIEFAGRGPTPPRQRVPEYGRLEANSLSVVLRIIFDEQPVALLAADLDAVALRHIVDRVHPLEAPVLVFPHHGGLPGTRDPREFTKSLMSAVNPTLVIFSISGDGRAANPRLEILNGVREAVPAAHIACTQLSVHCHTEHGQVDDWHLARGHAAGRAERRCCAGTVTITQINGVLAFDPPLDRHQAFVSKTVTTPQCASAVFIPRQALGGIADPTRPV